MLRAKKDRQLWRSKGHGKEKKKNVTNKHTYKEESECRHWSQITLSHISTLTTLKMSIAIGYITIYMKSMQSISPNINNNETTDEELRKLFKSKE